MTDHDVTDRLRTALDDVHHDRPVSQVARRARVLKARRRVPGAVAASLAVAGAITVAVGVTAPSSAFADWTSEPEPADPAVAAAIDASCRATGLDAGVADDELLVLDVRGQHAVALYRNEAGDVWDCNRFEGRPGPASWWNQGGGGGAAPIPEPTQTTPITFGGSGTSWNVHEGEMTWLSGRVVPGVARVEVGVPGSTVTAAMADGWWEAWWPSVAAETGTATITAYDGAGSVVATATVEVTGFGL